MRWATERVARRPRGGDRALLVVAGVVFVVAFVLALRALPDDDLEVRWPYLVAVAVLCVPAASALNAAEYVVSGRIDGHRITGRDAVRVAVLSSAANLLPIPGAALVRARALRALGSSYTRAVSATAAVGLAWVGTSLALAGGLLLLAPGDADPELGVGIGLLAGGVATLAASVVVMRRTAGPEVDVRGVAVATVAVEAAAVGVGALRYVLVLHGLGFSVGAAQAFALTVAAVVASAMGIFPGGLGLRELVAGAIAPVVGLPASVGLVGTAVDRLVGLPVLALMALALTVRLDRPRREAC